VLSALDRLHLFEIVLNVISQDEAFFLFIFIISANVSAATSYVSHMLGRLVTHVTSNLQK
jgi:hypothetical protein